VRELRNEVTRLWHLSGPALDDPSLVRAPARTAREEDGAETESLLLVDAERRAVERALAASEGRKDQAARLLGISRSGLYTKLARLGLE
jgi:DNA-binding NtrC family response regulator